MPREGGASSIPERCELAQAAPNTGSSAFADDDDLLCCSLESFFLSSGNLMSNTEIEIVVDDPTAPEADSPPVTDVRTADVVVSLLLLALALLLGYDNWRTGIAWDSTGPQAGYFPFYLSVVLGGASLYGLATTFLARSAPSETFVTRAQFRRVLAVFIPTLLFCLATQFLGLYVASFLLIAAFMRMVGKIALWKSLLTAFLFTAIMFVTFDIAFDVIMPKGPLEAAFGH
jgi:putative tricarboxylic transport membrane protein